MSFINTSNIGSVNPIGGSSSMNALQLAMLEDKIKEYVVSELKNMKSTLQSSQNKALKSLQQKHATSTKRLVKGLDRKMKETDSMLRYNLRTSNVMESSRLAGSASGSVFEVVEPRAAGAAPGQNIFATKLIEDIQYAVAAETLNCKPVEGADIPVRRVQYGRAGELLLVQDLENVQPTDEDFSERKQSFDHFEDIAGDLYDLSLNQNQYRYK